MLGRQCMETALQLHPLRRILLYTSSLPNHSPSNPQNLRAHAIYSAREALSLKRRRPANTIARQTRAPAQTTALMADKAPKNTAATLPSEPATQDISEKSPPRPPPPEKPLPGDCCGSGCVQCVWDLYYEELEAYNKLYKTDSDPKSKAS
ncbi:hypothetical protein L484_026789 [Morus notabilis]|uniref:Oxidoreductase-like domain-containing protein n=1 Tax=Morus notabilis TaxID=981085 RepID=W9SNA7_9ROSA|nr:uncharacterized protein LOC21409432 [Morus notabilis]EXC35482.1 hypothetical protein L484_026789 [Morus notabilis]